MRRRTFLRWVARSTGMFVPLSFRSLSGAAAEAEAAPLAAQDYMERRYWLARWESNIISGASNRYCDKETGEELGWLVSPFLSAAYYGYLATHDPKWIKLLVNWTDACIKRAVIEPDGFPGWPKGDGGGNESKEFKADSLTGEAMLLRPVVLMAERSAGTLRLRLNGVPMPRATSISLKRFSRSGTRGSAGASLSTAVCGSFRTGALTSKPANGPLATKTEKPTAFQPG